MRAEKDRTGLALKDLQDQEPGAFALVYHVPSGLPIVGPTVFRVWVDELEFDRNAGIVSGIRIDLISGDRVRVAAFPETYAWYLLNQNSVETGTLAEAYEAERANVAYRVQMDKDLKAVEKAAQGGDYVAPTPPPAPLTDQQQLDWLRRQFGEQDEEGPEKGL